MVGRWRDRVSEDHGRRTTWCGKQITFNSQVEPVDTLFIVQV